MTDDEYMQEFCNKSKNRRNLEEENLMDNLEDLKKQISDLQSKVAKIENESKEEKKGKRWRAKVNGTYFYVDDSGDVDVVPCYEYNDDGDNYRYKTRNYFKTKEEAEEYKEVMNTYYDLMDLAEELNNGEKIDWNDNQQCKYTIFYNFEFGQIYCLDGAFLEKAIEKIGKDKLTKLFTYERN